MFDLQNPLPLFRRFMNSKLIQPLKPIVLKIYKYTTRIENTKTWLKNLLVCLLEWKSNNICLLLIHRCRSFFSPTKSFLIISWNKMSNLTSPQALIRFLLVASSIWIEKKIIKQWPNYQKQGYWITSDSLHATPKLYRLH